LAEARLEKIQGDLFMRDRRHLRTALFIAATSATASVANNHTASAFEKFARRHAGFQSGIASTYSGGKTASGEHMNDGELTAAHPSLPFGTKVTVTNKHTGRTVVVRINDRGPFVKGRVIDLSPAAARAIGVNGLAQVSLSSN
jgi:rare lipoprotein A